MSLILSFFILLFPALHLCPKPSSVWFSAFLFPSIKAPLFIFKVFTFRNGWEQVGQPSLSCQWSCWATLLAPRSNSLASMLPLQEPPAHLPGLVLYIRFPNRVCMSEIPWSEQRGGWETLTQRKGYSALILELPLLLKLDMHLPPRLELQGRKEDWGNFADCLMLFSSQRACFGVFREVR